MKRIQNREENPALAQELADHLELSPLLSRLLVARGLKTADEVSSFLAADLFLEDPFSLKDMDRAVERLHSAIENGEFICVYGDYDADGVCSTALLTRYLKDVGAQVMSHIPPRSEGYGMSQEALKGIAEKGVNLVVTVDNGIVSIEETAFARSLGMEVIITDHHEPREMLPKATAVVNPHRPDCGSTFKDLCGAGVVFKLIAAMEGCDYDILFENYGDLAAIATIADVMPLVGENRRLVSEGLRHLAMTDNLGLGVMIDTLGLEPEAIDARSVAFRIVPRINAAGRMGRADTALQLFLTEDDEEASRLVALLEENNTERQEVSKRIQSDIDFQLCTHPERAWDSVLVLAGKGWNHGVLGICASKMVERLGKPTFLLEDEGAFSRGSGRSVAELNLAALLQECDDLLEKYGGHQGAAGLTIRTENLPALCKRINSSIDSAYQTMPVDECVVDLSMCPSDFSVEELRSLQRMEPTGRGNETPLFLLSDVEIERVYPLGEGKHVKVRGNQGGERVDILCFGVAKMDFGYQVGDRVDFVVHADINSYHGTESVSLKMQYMQLHDFNDELYFKSWLYFDQLMRGGEPDAGRVRLITPDRTDIGEVYRYLRAHPAYHQGEHILAQKMGCNYGKTRLSLMILEELKLIKVQKKDRVEWAEVVPKAAKVDLEKSRLLKRLHELGN